MSEAISIPILPCVDFEVMRAFYERLGFEVVYWEPSPGRPEEGYAIFRRDDIRLHFFGYPSLAPKDNYAGAYILTDDVSPLYEAVLALGLPQVGFPSYRPVEDKPWNMREFALLDPSGSLLRVGQALPR